MHVLIAEDDPLLLNALSRFLEREGHSVTPCVDGRQTLSLLAPFHQIDAVLLDLGLPQVDGLKVLKTLRSRGDATPVLVLTARGELSQRVQGLDAGADDYLTKPFDLEEVSARLRAITRCAHGRAQNRIYVGGLELDNGAKRCWLDGDEIHLTAKEFSLLDCLANRASRWLDRRMLENLLYGQETAPGSNAIEVHLSSLRRKLGAGLIHSERGLGWRLEDKREN